MEQKANVPSGWESKEDRYSPFLIRMEAYIDPAPSEAFYPPDKGDKSFEVWHLNNDGQWWMACFYYGTNIVLRRKLPRDFKECRIDYNPAVFRIGNHEITRTICK